MRALSLAQAANCEHATTARCRCRCRGAFHGRGRVSAHAPRGAWTALGADDPHYVRPTTAQRKQATFNFAGEAPCK